MKKISILTFIVGALFSGCRCPELLAPKINANTLTPDLGNKLILTAPHIEKTNVIWGGPNNAYLGESWIIDSVTTNNSGRYTAHYMYKNKRTCLSGTNSVIITVKSCPILPIPEILANSVLLRAGGKMILSVKPIEGINVRWIGPQGTFIGNPYIQDSINSKMSGEYKAQYFYPSISNCHSAMASKTIHINDTTQTISYKGRQYFLDYVANDNIGTIWFRVNKTSQSQKDIPIINWEAIKLSKNNVKKLICENVNVIDRAGTVVGCLQMTGGVACAYAIAIGQLEFLPVCKFIPPKLAYAGAESCLLGVAGDIASKIGQELPANFANIGVTIKKRELASGIVAAISTYCYVKQGETPITNAAGEIVPKPKPPPARTSRGGNGGHGEHGDPHPNSPRGPEPQKSEGPAKEAPKSAEPERSFPMGPMRSVKKKQQVK